MRARSVMLMHALCLYALYTTRLPHVFTVVRLVARLVKLPSRNTTPTGNRPVLVRGRQCRRAAARSAAGAPPRRSPPLQATRGAAKPSRACAAPGESAGLALCLPCRARRPVLPCSGGRGRAPSRAARLFAKGEEVRGRRMPRRVLALEPLGRPVAEHGPATAHQGSTSCALPAKGPGPRSVPPRPRKQPHVTHRRGALPAGGKAGAILNTVGRYAHTPVRPTPSLQTVSLDAPSFAPAGIDTAVFRLRGLRGLARPIRARVALSSHTLPLRGPQGVGMLAVRRARAHTCLM